jgi:hypothetical protein
MAYTEVDQLAINTIRVLAVCFFLSFLFTRSVGFAAVLYQRFLGETPSANRTPGRVWKPP